MSTKMIITCPCGVKYRVGLNACGKLLPCKKCRRITRIPAHLHPTGPNNTVSPRSASAEHPATGRNLISLGTGIGGLLVGFCTAEAWEWYQSPSHIVSSADVAVPLDSPPAMPQDLTQREEPGAEILPFPVKPSESTFAPSLPNRDDGSRRPVAEPMPQENLPEPASVDGATTTTAPESSKPATVPQQAAEPEPISDGLIAQTLNEAITQSQQHDHPILMLFISEQCGWCRKFQAETLANAAVRQMTKKYIFVVLDVNDPSNAALKKRYGVKGVPATIVADREGRLIQSVAGFQPDAKSFADWLNQPAVWRALRESESAAPSTSASDKAPIRPQQKSTPKRKRRSP